LRRRQFRRRSTLQRNRRR
jgi:hypothetical protein